MRILLFFLFCSVSLALECYTGFKYIAGQSVGTSKETCKNDMEYCYNATADLTSLNNLKMAGCSAARCFLSRNKCIEQTVAGKNIKFCCCNTGDLCNSKLTNLSTFGKLKERAKDILGIFGGKLAYPSYPDIIMVP